MRPNKSQMYRYAGRKALHDIKRAGNAYDSNESNEPNYGLVGFGIIGFVIFMIFLIATMGWYGVFISILLLIAAILLFMFYEYVTRESRMSNIPSEGIPGNEVLTNSALLVQDDLELYEILNELDELDIKQFIDDNWEQFVNRFENEQVAEEIKKNPLSMEVRLHVKEFIEDKMELFISINDEDTAKRILEKLGIKN